MADTTILTIRNITKTYPGVTALDDFSMEFKQGEIHALLGENGAGKSTLIKIISGAIEPDSGSIIFDGQEYKSISPGHARDLGIKVIYQEFNLVESLNGGAECFPGGNRGFLHQTIRISRKNPGRSLRK